MRRKEKRRKEKSSGKKVEDRTKEALSQDLGHSWTWWQ